MKETYKPDFIEHVSSNLMNAIQEIGYNGRFPDITNFFIPNNIEKEGNTYEGQSIGQDLFLLPRKAQEKRYLKRGYIKQKNKDYGLVKKAVGNNNYPIYQRNPNEADRKDLLVASNKQIIDLTPRSDKSLSAPGYHPHAFYINTKTGEPYYNEWDLFNYGKDANGRHGSTSFGSGTFNISEKMVDLLDKIGNPVVLTTGYIKANKPKFSEQYTKENYIQDLNSLLEEAKTLSINNENSIYPNYVWDNNKVELQLPEIIVKQHGGEMNYIDFFKSGGIHIKKKNRGKFTDYCGGKVTEECIQRGKHSSNPTTRKRATFAANARKWKHQSGGELINPKKRTFFQRVKVETPEKNKYTLYLPEDNNISLPEISTSEQQTSYDLSDYIFPAIKEAIIKDSKSKTFANKAEFISSLSSAYKSAGFSNDLVKLLVAQDALESGWGQKPVGDYNYGNIKKGSSWKGKTKSAMDDEKTPSHYRSYNDYREYVADKVNLLKKTYGITTNDTVEQAIAKLNGSNSGKYKYATSPTYAQNLLSVYRSLN